MDGKIKHDFNSEKQTALKLEKIEEAVCNAASEHKSVMNDLQLAWNDEQGGRIYEKMLCADEQLHEILQEISELRERIVRKSQLFYEAEQQAKNIAESDGGE